MWHHAGKYQFDEWIQPTRHFESPESKRRMFNLLDISGILQHQNIERFQPRLATDEEILSSDDKDIKFILWDAIRYDGFVEGKDTRIGYNWRFNGLEHMMMLAIEKNPDPCYSVPKQHVCGSLEDAKKFIDEQQCSAVIKNLSGTWALGKTKDELFLEQ